MSVVIPTLMLAYFPFSKAACTSLKYLIFEIENGFVFRNDRANGKAVTIHQVLRSKPFEVTARPTGPSPQPQRHTL